MKNIPNKIIQEENFNNKVWLEASTLNMLPGEVVSFTIKDQETDESLTQQATVNKDGKAFLLIEPSIDNEIANTAPITQNQQTYLLKKGWWALDEEGKQPITGAVPGMLVYFHIETTIPNNQKVQITLFNKADAQKNTLATSTETVTNGKIVSRLPLHSLQNQLKNTAVELYYECKYKDTPTIKLPEDTKAYLTVKTLVIDRYKMPGLNEEGTDIADDLTYGTGQPKPDKKRIYKEEQVKKYLDEYKNEGFDAVKHALFTNKEDLPAVKPILIQQPDKNEEDTVNSNNRFSTIIEEIKPKQDHTYVKKPDFNHVYKQAKNKAETATKNLKAKYSEEDCYSTSYKIKVDIPYTDVLDFKVPIPTGLDVRIFNTLPDEKLFWNFEKTAELYFAKGELQLNLNRMIAKFKSNTGGVYEDAVLTKSIKNHPVTKRYCMYMENYIAEKIKQETIQSILNIEDKESDFIKFEDDINIKRRKKRKIKGNDITSEDDGLTIILTRPSYSVRGMGLLEASKGLTIALNDIWATEVVLKELKNNGENYTAKYQVTLWDHFGLDKPDMEKIFNIIPSIGETFVCWFILQHLRGYKPFVTKITFEKEFKGTIKEGREERRTKQKEKEQALIRAEKEKEAALLKQYKKHSWEHNGTEPWHKNY